MKTLCSTAQKLANQIQKLSSVSDFSVYSENSFNFLYDDVRLSIYIGDQWKEGVFEICYKGEIPSCLKQSDNLDFIRSECIEDWNCLSECLHYYANGNFIISLVHQEMYKLQGQLNSFKKFLNNK